MASCTRYGRELALTQLTVHLTVLCMAQLPALLSTSQAAEVLCVSDDAVRRWARTGALRAITLPSGVFRFRRSDIDAILRNGDEDQATAGAA